MTRPLLALPFAALPLAVAPADAVRGGDPAGPVAEVVTFRLAPGVTDAAFLSAARATGPLLAAEPGFLSRRLSQGADEAWTDHVVWKSLAEAHAAAARILEAPAAAPFLMAIDPASIALRHEWLLITME